MTVLLVLFALSLAAVATIVVVDVVTLRGEEYTFSRRVRRYQVACQFLWADFKDWVSGRNSRSSASEPEPIQSPDDHPESGSEPEPGP